MSESQDDWLATRIEAAVREQQVAEAVALAVKTELQGTMGQRPLRPSELDALAVSLLKMTSQPQDRETSE
jgi:hypothetical protein